MIETRRCGRCGCEKSLADFYKRTDRRGGPRSTCKSCCNAQSREWNRAKRAHMRELNKAWREANPQRVVDHDRNRKLKKYGLTVDDYEALLRGQGGVCAICLESPQPTAGPNRNGILFVDHCHDTGKVRGLLCQKCNTAIGYLRDDPEITARASAYLSNRKPAI